MGQSISAMELRFVRWRNWLRWLGVAALFCVAIPGARAQEPELQGVDQGNYNIRQSVEFGGRITSLSGNLQTYNTFINLQQGPRLLGFTTEMRALDHQGTLIDRLYFSNFGYGGDPNNVSRLRMSKNKWYNFDALFRRDENFWNYSLLANPLNPTTPFANAPTSFTPIISTSPHLFNTRRRMGDYNLQLLPQSKVHFRLGYSRSVADGPSFTTIHQGTEQLLFQNWKTTVNSYRLGVDYQILPRTSISYDQIWSYYKGDTGSSDNNQLFKLANGTPVDLGVSFNAGANQPCGGTFLPPPAAPGTVNPTCSAAFSYSRNGRTRTNAPTEQFSLQSNYFQDIDLSARFNYTGSDMNVFGYNEQFTGREARTNLRNFLGSGPVMGRRVAATADFGATWRITESLSFLDSFHFRNFHNPVEWDSSSCGFFSPSLLTRANIFAAASPLPLICSAPTDGVTGTPAHTTSSGPDIALAVWSRFLKQDEKTNLAELDYQFTQHFGARLGYRYRSRTIADATFASGTFVFFPNNQNNRALPAPFNTMKCSAPNRPDGSCLSSPTAFVDSSEIPIHEHAAVFGFWARPLKNLRISFDTDLMSADNSFTRISPRQTQEYRLRGTYKPANWMNLSASAAIWEGRNNVPQINNLQHNRAYGFSAIFEPNDRFALELGYDYNDVFSQILICYVSSVAPAGVAKCPGQTILNEQLSTYTNKSNYGHLDLMLRPINRFTTHLGANITVTDGNALLIITPQVPKGPLNSKYYQPFGGLEYQFAKSWTGKAYWNYYGYSEENSLVVQDLFAPRNFRAHLVTLSVRYAF
ncbi:MAG TPA: hypothetical protein VOA64_13535 [Candidatus Dormibacteraeota bacterium]|nr:hypothetical protein [Candidatus Dormibacteraeota bacterium]